MTVLKLQRVEALAVRADLQPGDHCRILLAGPLILPKPAKHPLADLVLKAAWWSEPAPTCPSCGSDV
jgi:hypothetical protein